MQSVINQYCSKAMQFSGSIIIQFNYGLVTLQVQVLEACLRLIKSENLCDQPTADSIKFTLKSTNMFRFLAVSSGCGLGAG